MIDNNERRLRLYASRCGHKGSSEARDRCIQWFLADLRAVFSKAFIEHLDDDTLGSLYVDWGRVATEGIEADDRQRLLIEGWPTPVTPFTRAMRRDEEAPAPEPPDSKVVPLNARASR